MSRVTEIRYVGYGVQDLDAEKQYYENVWGLEPVPSDDGMAWFKTQGHDEHHVVRLRAAEENRIDVIALAADSRGDVDALHAKVGAAGCRIVRAPAELTTPGGGYGFRFFSPDGLLFEVSSDVRAASAATSRAGKACR
jgi:catechol 2,3-dioxygenase-like lactoylglutathione lyase family enzyme